MCLHNMHQDMTPRTRPATMNGGARGPIATTHKRLASCFDIQTARIHVAITASVVNERKETIDSKNEMSNLDAG